MASNVPTLNNFELPTLNNNLPPSRKQRWSPRGRLWPPEHILRSLSLVSKPQVLENCSVLGSRTALFFEWLKCCRSAEKCFSRPFFFLESAWKNFFKIFFLEIFFLRTLAFVSLVLGLGLEHSCSWPRKCLSSEGLSLDLASDFFFLCPWPWFRALCLWLHLCSLVFTRQNTFEKT